jgi:two-component system sensor histidine kinase UhpB
LERPKTRPGPPEAEGPPGLEHIAARLAEINARNERLMAQMVDGERRFRTLAKAVWKVQEEERRRLARELHDGIGQTLTALVNRLRRQPRRDDAGGDADPLEIAELALRDVRELSRLLRPPVLDDLGLKAAMHWLARTMRAQAGLAVSVEWQGEEGRLDAEVETLVFRVAQEALTNVIKHAGVNAARIAVRRLPDDFELAIADDGRGFDVDLVLAPGGGAAGLGLRGIRDRVELFGGQFAIESSAGRGSALRIVVPLAGTAPC